MARGKKPTDSKHQSEHDLLEYLPLMETLALPDTIVEPDAPAAELTAISIARIAESAVEQYAKTLRQGTAGLFRNRARQVVEAALAESCYHSGRWEELLRQTHLGKVSREEFIELTRPLRERQLECCRKAASHTALILKDILQRQERKGTKGRPKGTGNSDLLLERQDTDVINWAILCAAPARDYDSIVAIIPAAVRQAIRLGTLRPIGGKYDDEQTRVDRHTKRIRASFKRIVANHKGGGFSISRKLR